MSLAIAPERTRPPHSQLADIADFASDECVPDVPWLTRLDLQEPRRNLHSLELGTRIAKRVTDVCGALVLLALLWPVMFVAAILVRLTSPGPVIYRQVRVGLNLREADRDRRRSREAGLAGQGDSGCPQTGVQRRSRSDRRSEFAYGRHFVLYKFRTMRNDAEKHGARFAVKGDARVTPIGHFLRKTRIDELPQLWNVLKGEMSLVGPRPERPEFIEELSEQIPDYLQRLGLKPGLTGVAQIVNGYDNNIESFRRKVAFDVLYLQHCCWWNDVKILLRTVQVVLSGSGAL
jgi:lipopolysaccharide/colanic/teichoic acid biosynthesis glycosyltransferase